VPGPASPLARVRDRGVMGQGPARFGDASPAPLEAIARVRELSPNPIGSDTSCRVPAAFVAGVATTPFELAIASRFRTLRPRFSFRQAQERAASRALPRRRARYAAPEVPSVSETSP
jgi:hypothetical protein